MDNELDFGGSLWCGGVVFDAREARAVGRRRAGAGGGRRRVVEHPRGRRRRRAAGDDGGDSVRVGDVFRRAPVAREVAPLFGVYRSDTTRVVVCSRRGIWDCW